MLSRQDYKEAITLYHRWGFKQTYKCPCCGSDLQKRQGPKTEFMGCKRYPDCKGSRFLSGQPTFNKFAIDLWRGFKKDYDASIEASRRLAERIRQREEEQQRLNNMSPVERRFHEIAE